MDIGLLLAILVVIQILPALLDEARLPLGLYGFGLTGGAALALQAAGMILVYRSNRIINFAQVQVGAVAAAFFVAMVQYLPILRLFSYVCPPCLVSAPRGFQIFNYFFSLIAAMGLAVLISYLVYFVARRFREAPRLVLTVATIFIAQLLGGMQGWLPQLLANEDQREAGVQLSAAKPPFSLSLRVAGTTFQAPDIMMFVVAIAAIALLSVWLRRSSTGTAIRASAENADRAQSVGINVTKVTGRVWLIAGGLSGIVAILTAMSIGVGSQPTLSAGGMVRILAVAVIARLVSLPITVAAALVMGIFEQAVLWFFSSVTPLDGLLLVVLALVLLVQPYRLSRAELDQASGWQAARQIRPIPRELRGLPIITKWLRGGATVGLGLALGLPWVMSPSQTNLLAYVMIVGVVSLSVLVLTGWAGQISLGQFAFAAIGGYVAAVLQIPFLLALIAGSLAGGLVALLIGLPAIKMRGLHLAITTLSFALAVSAILLNPNYLGKALPATLERPTFLGLDMEDDRTFYYFTLVVLIFVVTAVVGLRRSRMARALIAARDNEQAAQSFGINLLTARLTAFAVSGLIAALAGALFAFHQHGVRAISYAPEVSVRMFLIAVIGGLGGVWAPLVGVTLFEGVLTIVTTNPVVTFLATGGGGLAVLLLAPGGLAQVIVNMRDSILRSIARRSRIVVPSLLADVDPTLETPRVPIAPKLKPGGGGAFVPRRYEVGGQWALDGEDGEKETAAAAFMGKEAGHE